MPTRMERYYKSNDVKSRTAKNQDLYRTIYDEAEYSNVEGISVIEKNEKIDINMIKELINGTHDVSKSKSTRVEKQEPIIVEEEQKRNYDIMDVLSKAKNERTTKERKITDTQYNIFKNANLNDNTKVSSDIGEEDLKNMIETISNNSKNGYTTNLLDDLRTIHDPNLKEEINETDETNEEVEVDKSFYTSSLGFTNDDFEDLKEMKNDIKKNNVLTKVLLFILLVVVVTGIIFLVYHFTR